MADASGESARTAPAPLHIVVMGVSGSGKSTVGRALAQALGLDFIEGDERHPPANVAKMAAGQPLTDADRAGWLQACGSALAQAGRAGAVLSCSALKRAYRDALRRHVPGLRLVHLHGSPSLLAQRMHARPGHYMPVSLLPSQLDTLQVPAPEEAAVVLDIAASPAELVQAVRRHWGLPAGSAGPAAANENTVSDATSAAFPVFHRVILATDPDGRARFREEPLVLGEGKPQARLSPWLPAEGLQLRVSPVGFRSDFHCTQVPQWLFVLRGCMEIGLQDGSTRCFRPGDHFYSADTLPEGATFDPAVHGHWSRQVGDEPLVTAFVRG